MRASGKLKKRLALGGIVLLVAVAIPSAMAAKTRKNTSCRKKASSLDGSFYFQDLKNLISCGGFTSIEEVMARLPERFRKEAILVYASSSRHKDSSFEFPRIIMKDENARMIIAVAGSPSQINGYDMEVIDFPPQKSNFTFHKISFAPDRSQPRFSENNPEECRGCHRMDNPSPNWEAYPLWPGAYGSGGLAALDEAPHFASLLARIKSDPVKMSRFQSLEFESRPDVAEQEFLNHKFSSSLGSLNSDRLVSAIRNHPLFDKLKYAMAYYAKGSDRIGDEARWNNCDTGISSILPEEFRSKMTVSYDDYFEAVRKDTLNHFNQEKQSEVELVYRGDDASHRSFSDYQPRTDWTFFFAAKPFVGIGYVMKYAMGIDPEAYSITFNASTYNSHHTLLKIEDEILGYELMHTSCEELLKKSRAAHR
jgi:hypothetical protein